MDRAKSYFSPIAEFAEERSFMFAVVRGPALSNEIQAAANIKPQLENLQRVGKRSQCVIG